MSDLIAFLEANEPAIRLGAFGGVFLAMAAWEFLAPGRAQALGRLVRWPNNLGVAFLNALLVRILFPAAAVGFAWWAAAENWGFFNLVDTPVWLAIVASVLLLDLAIYGQHALFHAVPVLWRLHRMHHADTEFDVTTGLRFHPVEILLSMAIKFVVVAALGAPPVAVLIFEILLNATALFNHGNVRLPGGADRVIRWLLVTPDMHRVHHSVRRDETDSNYGFNVPWWDRLFGTYRAQPADGHEGMSIGIPKFRDPREAWLDRMLIQPGRGPAR
jgi:sterol desaturase/sphingolipid hydroxylase (fatty acid hydroxylase superfamily)